MKRNFSSTARGKQIMGWHNCEVSLKNSNGLLVGKGILLFEIQTGDDVGGLILFPHQVAVRITEVYPCGKKKQNEDGQVLKKCIGQIVQWSRSAAHAIENVPEATTPSISMEEELYFNDDMSYPNKNSTERRNQSMHKHLGQEERPEEMNKEGSDVSAAICTVFGVDGLALNVPKRKYYKTKRVAQHKGDR